RERSGPAIASFVADAGRSTRRLFPSSRGSQSGMHAKRTKTVSTKLVEVAGEPCYAIADAARILGRSRPTLMRWTGHLRRFTGHPALQDRTGRWFFPANAVERLQHDGDLLKRLAAAASNGHGDELMRVVRDVSMLKKTV